MEKDDEVFIVDMTAAEMALERDARKKKQAAG